MDRRKISSIKTIYEQFVAEADKIKSCRLFYLSFNKNQGPEIYGYILKNIRSSPH